MLLTGPRINLALFLVALIPITVRAATPDLTEADLDQRFTSTVRPFLNTYCVECHSGEKPKADFDLKAFASLATVVNDYQHWVMESARKTHSTRKCLQPRPRTSQMNAKPDRKSSIGSQRSSFSSNESAKNAGDPRQRAPARRLSNAEYDYSIRDLTGVDIKPAREFPVDPSNMAGFDNSGESLTMSPTLLNKYAPAGGAAKVADHMYLRERRLCLCPASDGGLRT